MMKNLPITIPKITPQTIEVFYKDASIGFFNEYEFNDIRVQIKRGKLTGFKVKYNGSFFDIDINGRLFFPDGMFDLIAEQLHQLIIYET